MKIGNRKIGKNEPCFIIAELSANHNQDIEIAKQTIKAATEAGVDAIKMQTYTADSITIDSDKEYFHINQGTLWDGETLYSLYQKAYTPWEWQKELKEYAESLGLICFSSPFDKKAVDFLESINVPAYKIASFEITDIPLIKYAASKGKPMIISTGIAEKKDIEEAINACKSVGNKEIILLKCTSAYPAPYEEMNLITIPDMAKKFNVITGLSDHSLGSEIAISALTLGAKVIEKHIILNKEIKTPDSDFSMTAEEFKIMVNSIRNVEKAIGKVSYELSEKSKKNRKFARSLFVVKDIKKGEEFTDKNIRSIRPSDGLEPKYLYRIIGKMAKNSIEKGTPLSFDMIED